MGRNNKDFHLGRRGPGWYEGHGYMIERHENGREWNIHYPDTNGEPRAAADDVVGTLSTAKDWARSHWEENRDQS